MQSDNYCYLNSPVGWLRLTADEDGLTSVEFLEEPPTDTPIVQSPHLKLAYRQLNEYFSGERMTFTLPLSIKGTPFQKKVWEYLTRIPFGTTVSYKDIAETIGSPKGSRAVGMANNKNPLPIVVPCHRVIGTGGDLLGYSSGPGVKRKLLQLEGLEVKPGE